MEFSSTLAFQECICSCLKAYINELIIGYPELATYVTLTMTLQNLEGIALCSLSILGKIMFQPLAFLRNLN